MEMQLSECYQSLVRDRKLVVELPPRQIQRGGLDCGLFAIAFAYNLASGNDPSQITYDQSRMREQLVKCLEKGSFEPFPRQRKSNSIQFVKEFISLDINVFCHCSMPESWDDMIQCDLCNGYDNLLYYPENTFCISVL